MNFDIDRYLASVEALDDLDIDYASFATRPVEPDLLRCLQYMHDIEHHTTCYLRDLLVTSAHEDPAITSFLTMWAYEEHWHGEAIGRVLDAHGLDNGRARISTTRRRVGRDRLRTLGFMSISALTDHVVAIAMTWGAINEWTTQAGYLRLAQLTDQPQLQRLLRRIARQEGRHIDFYVTQSEQRLASGAAQRWVRTALRTKWKPVGSNVMPRAETDHVIATLFAGDDGRAMADRIDARISRLPGLDGLGLVAGSRAAALVA